MNIFKKIVGLFYSTSIVVDVVKKEETPKFLLPKTAKEYDQRCKVLVELSRRETAKFQRYMRKANSLRKILDCLQYELEEELEKLLATLRKKESETLAHQGEIVKQSFDDSSAKNEGYSFGGGPGPAVRHERRLVRYDERVFLVHLSWYAVTRTIHHSSGGWYNRAYDKYVPTGEWKPPVTDWATDSLSQMSNEELKATE